MGFIRTRIMVRRVMKGLEKAAPQQQMWKQLVGYLAWGRRPASHLAEELISLYLQCREALGPLGSVAGELPEFERLQGAWEEFVACCQVPQGLERTTAGVWIVLMLGADWALARTVEMAMDPGMRWRAVARAVERLLKEVEESLLGPATAALHSRGCADARQAA